MPDTTDDSGTISETTSFDREGRTVPEARRNESDETSNGTASSPATADQPSPQQQPPDASTAAASQTTDIDRVISAGKTASEPLIEAATRIRTDSLSGVTARLILLTYIGVAIVTGGAVAMFLRTAMLDSGGAGRLPTELIVTMTGAVVFPTAGLLLTGVLAYVIVLTYDTDTVKTVLLSGSIACVVGHCLFLGVVFTLLSLSVPGVGGSAVDLVGYTTATVVSGLLAGVFFTTISYVGASVLQL